MTIEWPKSQQSQAYTQLEEDLSKEDYVKPPQPRQYLALQLLQHALSFIAGVAVTVLFVVVVYPRLFKLPAEEHPEISEASAQHLAVELTRSPVPSIPLTTYTFEENVTFTARPSSETDWAWNSLLPPGRGFVFIDDPSQYDLPPGQDTKWGEIYSVSLFHQIHCLGELRKAYWTLINGVETGDIRKSKLLVGKHGQHVHHCFDYIRQGIMCAGDMSMEWPRTEPNGQRIAVDGWGAKHTCKSWDAIQKYMEDNHFDHSLNQDIAP